MTAIHSLPTVRTMVARLNIDEKKATRIRSLMEAHREANWKGGVSVMGTLRMIDTVLGTFGVEIIPQGRGKASPQIMYCNTGETYDTTLLFCRGTFHVTCWGDIVERGNYA